MNTVSCPAVQFKAAPCFEQHKMSRSDFIIVSSLVQVYNGSAGPGDASAWRAEGQRLEDHQ